MSKVFIALDLLEVHNRRRASARLLEDRLQLSAALGGVGARLMKRWLFNLAAALSLLLSIAAAAAWATSYAQPAGWRLSGPHTQRT